MQILVVVASALVRTWSRDAEPSFVSTVLEHG
jgi:hypothetical protein